MSEFSQGQDALGMRYQRCAISQHAEVMVLVHDNRALLQPGFSELAKAAAWLCAEELRKDRVVLSEQKP